MQANILLSVLKAQGHNVDWLADRMNDNGANISTTSIYNKLRGGSEFKTSEIKAISQALGLTNDEMLNIFFKELIS